MIGSLRGAILEKLPEVDKSIGDVLIEVNNVGYFVTVTNNVLSSLESSEAFLYIYHHITEASQRLFGFLTNQDRITFKGLLGAHGVGPSLALAVMGTHSVSDLARILEAEDVDALCEVPGVGKKTAQRLIVELKSSLVLPVIDGVTTIDLTNSGAKDPLTDVREALTSLGYSSQEIRTALAGIKVEETDDSGAILKLALRSLGGV